jgi:hypothetical protein
LRFPKVARLLLAVLGEGALLDRAYAHSPVVLKPAARPLLAAMFKFHGAEELRNAPSAALLPTSGASVGDWCRVQRNAGSRIAAVPPTEGRPSGIVKLTQLPHVFVTASALPAPAQSRSAETTLNVGNAAEV